MEGLATTRHLPIDVVRWLRLHGESGESIGLVQIAAQRAAATFDYTAKPPPTQWMWTHQLLTPLESSYRASLSVGKVDNAT